jgi:hypothetical protein
VAAMLPASVGTAALMTSLWVSFVGSGADMTIFIVDKYSNKLKIKTVR